MPEQAPVVRDTRALVCRSKALRLRTEEVAGLPRVLGDRVVAAGP